MFGEHFEDLQYTAAPPFQDRCFDTKLYFCVCIPVRLQFRQSYVTAVILKCHRIRNDARCGCFARIYAVKRLI